MWPKGFRFDPDDIAGSTPSEPSAPATPAAEPPAPVEPAAATAPEPAAPATWAGPPEDEWYETQQLLRQLAQRVGGQPAPGPAAQPAQPEPSFELDPFDDSYGQNLAAFLERRDQQLLERIEGMFQPIQAHHQQEAHQEAEQRAKDVLTDYASQKGVEYNVSLARALADQFLDESFARYGNTPRGAEAALHKAADQLIENNRQVREQAINEYKASLERATQTPGEPGSATPGLVLEGEAESEADAVARVMARLTAA